MLETLYLGYDLLLEMAPLPRTNRRFVFILKAFWKIIHKEIIMTKKLSLITGIGLVLLGGLALVSNYVLPAFGLDFRWWAFWRLWPLIVIAIGLLFCVPPILAREKRGLGALFIPGLPVLVTGGILFFCSIFNIWDAWLFLWPLEPLALGLGFGLAAFWMRSSGLAFPALIIGLNGAVLAFCNTTGWWEAWTVLWAIEPLSLGLSFLILGASKSNKALVGLGLAFSAFSAVAAFGMIVLMLSGWSIFRLVWPLLFIFTGVIVIALGLIRPRRAEDDEPTASGMDVEPLQEGGGA